MHTNYRRRVSRRQKYPYTDAARRAMLRNDRKRATMRMTSRLIREGLVEIIEEAADMAAWEAAMWEEMDLILGRSHKAPVEFWDEDEAYYGDADYEGNRYEEDDYSFLDYVPDYNHNNYAV